MSPYAQSTGGENEDKGESTLHRFQKASQWGRSLGPLDARAPVLITALSLLFGVQRQLPCSPQDLGGQGQRQLNTASLKQEYLLATRVLGRMKQNHKCHPPSTVPGTSIKDDGSKKRHSKLGEGSSKALKSASCTTKWELPPFLHMSYISKTEEHFSFITWCDITALVVKQQALESSRRCW